MADLPSESAAWPSYYLFGSTVRSNFPFQIELPVSESRPDLTLSYRPGETAGLEDGVEPIYVSDIQTPDGVPLARLYPAGGGRLLRLAGVADYEITRDRLQCFPVTDSISAVEAFLFQAALSFWLETTGRPVLHASSIAAAGRAVAFLAFSGRGKSTLAAGFLKDGYRLISDDSLPVEMKADAVLAWPCHPRLKMTPEQVQLFLDDVAHLSPVNDFSGKVGVAVSETWSGSFSTAPEKLVCCYLPEHSTERTQVAIEPIRGAEAVIELVRHSLVPRLTFAAGLQGERFQRLHQIAARLEVCRLCYPSGVDSLGAVREAVLKHLENLD